MITSNPAVELARQGKSPEVIAEILGKPLGEVQLALARAGFDWKPVGSRGRPRLPILPGQQKYIEVAYGLGHSESAISVAAKMSLERVRRHLDRSGLERRRRGQVPEDIRLEAVELYIRGTPVMRIVAKTGLTAPDLYKSLRRLGVSLRNERLP